MGTIRSLSSRKLRMSALWILLHYKHPRPDPALAQKHHSDAYLRSDVWRQTLRDVDLNNHWVEVLHDMAVKQAEAEEGAAQRAAFLSFLGCMRAPQPD